EEPDILPALFELVENGKAAPKQRASVDGRLDALPAAVEQGDAERVLHVGDRSRHGWLRDREPRRGLRHAAGVSDREQNIQIAECEPTADAVIPVHIWSSHRSHTSIRT